ncbi:hypothetical protein QI30_17020 [Kurthia sp. 3B1D]|uniref:Uncharacterized protein n=1 Tax=Candidatus Kurthia intestinigallinarum TaxID=1562256 RepID=A0A433RQ53_9BACL|nr:hypothetical protein [Kurthia sp. 3B1D]RUS52464.1 hypothetical protein QI30_17020 [Kurthia sp. 3B1D]
MTKWPLFITVGQVIIFPYYLFWLKNSTLTFSLFALIFALFSFGAALGYHLQQKWTMPIALPIALLGMIYMLTLDVESLYIISVMQVILGFLQGYFRAWHVGQETYKLQVVWHYVIVGLAMVALSTVTIVVPQIFVAIYGFMLVICAIVMALKKCKKK